MKKGSYLINASRGTVVVVDELVAAIERDGLLPLDQHRSVGQHFGYSDADLARQRVRLVGAAAAIEGAVAAGAGVAGAAPQRRIQRGGSSTPRKA